jgi:hypothetical protein
MALNGLDGPFIRTDFLNKIEQRRKAERKATGKFRGLFNRMDRNFIRRRYQDFLTRNYIPILEQMEGREWQVTSAQDLFSSSFRRVLDIDPRHLQGSLVKGGKKVGAVDGKGRFV